MQTIMPLPSGRLPAADSISIRMDIKRVDTYIDDRFSELVLCQHGAYLVDGEPYQIEIVSTAEAVIRGEDPAVFKALIEEFRFHAPHICSFFDDAGRLVAEYPAPGIFEIRLESIQPSQFFVDEEKLKAVQTFIHKPEDIIVQVIRYGSRFISLDGHTRLYLAALRNYSTVKAVESETDDWVWAFVQEAERRNILCPGEMTLLAHEQYEIQWNQYCDPVFAGEL